MSDPFDTLTPAPSDAPATAVDVEDPAIEAE